MSDFRSVERLSKQDHFMSTVMCHCAKCTITRSAVVCALPAKSLLMADVSPL